MSMGIVVLLFAHCLFVWVMPAVWYDIQLFTIQMTLHHPQPQMHLEAH